MHTPPLPPPFLRAEFFDGPQYFLSPWGMCLYNPWDWDYDGLHAHDWVMLHGPSNLNKGDYLSGLDLTT